MKKLTLFLLSFLSMLLSFAQVVADANIEKRTVADFTGIEVATGIRVVLTEGNTPEVAVSAATAEFRNNIETVVEDNILKIRYKSKKKANNKKEESKNLKAYVSYQQLHSLLASTGARVEVTGILKSKKMKIELTTGAKMNAKVEIVELSFSQSTGAKSMLTGNVDNMKIEGSTGSKFDGSQLNVAVCEVNVSTGAVYKIHVNERLEATATTGAKIEYTGAVTGQKLKTTTGGKISKA